MLISIQSFLCSANDVNRQVLVKLYENFGLVQSCLDFWLHGTKYGSLFCGILQFRGFLFLGTCSPRNMCLGESWTRYQACGFKRWMFSLKMQYYSTTFCLIFVEQVYAHMYISLRECFPCSRIKLVHFCMWRTISLSCGTHFNMQPTACNKGFVHVSWGICTFNLSTSTSLILKPHFPRCW